MRVILFALIFVLVVSAVYAEPSINKEMPLETEEGTTIEIRIIITPNSVDRFDIAEMIPLGWEIDTWNVNPDVDVSLNSREHRDKLINHWNFNSVFEDVELTYNLKAEEVGEFDFKTIFIYPIGMHEELNELTVYEKSENEISSPLTGRFIGTNQEKESEENNLIFNIFSRLRESISSIKY